MNLAYRYDEMKLRVRLRFHTSANVSRYTGKERDAESGNDYFGARYYASTMGRWMSPDPMGGHLENPQTLNKYAYVTNNPLTLTDPTGLDSYLACNNNSSACGAAVVGYDKNGQAQWAAVQGVNGANGFTATVIGNANADGSGGLVDKTTGTGAYTASVNGSGVQFSNNGGQNSSSGVFINGTPQTNFQDAGWANGGALSGFQFTLTHSKMEADQNEAGTFAFSGDLDQARSAIQAAGFHYWPLGRDVGSDEFRSPGDKGTGANSGHFVLNRSFLPPKSGVPQVGGNMHFGETNPMSDLPTHIHEAIQ
jgi:RHS repeat-associated protein